jgi:hypothetical protein
VPPTGASTSTRRPTRTRLPRSAIACPVFAGYQSTSAEPSASKSPTSGRNPEPGPSTPALVNAPRVPPYQTESRERPVYQRMSSWPSASKSPATGVAVPSVSTRTGSNLRLVWPYQIVSCGRPGAYQKTSVAPSPSKSPTNGRYDPSTDTLTFVMPRSAPPYQTRSAARPGA